MIKQRQAVPRVGGTACLCRSLVHSGAFAEAEYGEAETGDEDVLQLLCHPTIYPKLSIIMTLLTRYAVNLHRWLVLL